MDELGSLETVELRTVWPKETDFSAWLAEHVEILNEQIVCKIEPGSVQQEVPAWGGLKSVDLLGDATFRDASKRFKVIVENQLEATDSDHLGDVLQYAAAFNARVAIWIAGHAGPGHVEAVRLVWSVPTRAGRPPTPKVRRYWTGTRACCPRSPKHAAAMTGGRAFGPPR